MSVSCFLIILIFLFLLLFGDKIKKLSAFRQSMLKNMVPALVIGLIAFAGYAVGTFRLSGAVGGFFIGALAFCCSALGLALAKSIPGFEPLPVAESFAAKQGRSRQIFLFLLTAVLLAVLILATDASKALFLTLFHESDRSTQAVGSLPAPNKLLAFPLLLSGAGIAEESMFRLFFQSLFWRLFKRPWPAILLSSLCTISRLRIRCTRYTGIIR